MNKILGTLLVLLSAACTTTEPDRVVQPGDILHTDWSYVGNSDHIDYPCTFYVDAPCPFLIYTNTAVVDDTSIAFTDADDVYMPDHGGFANEAPPQLEELVLDVNGAIVLQPAKVGNTLRHAARLEPTLTGYQGTVSFTYAGISGENAWELTLTYR